MNDHDQNDEIDPLTGASIYGRAHMAWLLKISERQLDRLENLGVLTRRPDGKFHVVQTMDAFSAYQAAKSSKPSPHDKVRLRQSEVISRQIARDDANSITMAEALETIDDIVRVFLQALDVIGREVAPIASDPARAALVVEHTKTELAEKFATHRQALIAGPKKRKSHV